jgi:uncharacterized repeat protein (TIGR03803 family)
MTKLSAWKKASAVVLLCAATALAAHAQMFKTLVNFDSTDGATPVYPGLVQGIGGNLYGTTLVGGVHASGTVFKLTPSGKLTTLYSLCSQANCADGYQPQAGLVLGTDGDLYGATTQGGVYGYGTVFKINSRGVLTTLHSFDLTDGAGPYAPPVQASDGNFYGTTTFGGEDSGTVFKMTPDGVLTTLYNFIGIGPSLGTLVQATDGALYGTVELGGGSCGSIFRITTGDAFEIFHAFDCTDGGSPASGLIQATDGKLYGTTYIGGSNTTCNNGCGTLFKISLKGSLTTVYNFDLTHGANPNSAMVEGSDGNLYGTTYGGGTNGGWGTIFRLSANGTLTTLHSFNLTDGAQPYGALVQDTSGNFYGTTPNGGSNSRGILFGLSTALGPFVAFVRNPAKVGQRFGILWQGFTGTTSVSLNGIPANFTIVSDTHI